jgi:hypothetical protein
MERVESINQPKSSEPATQDELIARLKEVDPVFGSRFEKVEAMMNKVEALESTQHEVEMDSIRKEAQSRISALNEASKVPEALRQTYALEIEKMAQENPQRFKDWADVEAAHKEVHDRYSKFLDGYRRETTKQYVSEKKADSSAPVTQPKGAPAGKQAQGSPKDKEEMLASIASSALSKFRQDRQT